MRGVGNDPNRLADELFAGLPDRYDLLVEVLTFGQNRRWRREMVDRLADRLPASGPRPPLLVDVASGTAGVALQLAGRLGAEVVGVDLSLPMLRRGQRNLQARSVGRPHRVRLVAGRAEQLPLPDASVDGITFTYLLRYVADVPSTLAELTRVLRPGAPMASLDFLAPPEPGWRAAWWGYTRLVLPAAGWLAGGPAWRRVGTFLGPSIEDHYRRHPVDDLVQAWRAAGMEEVGARQMSLGGGLVMWGRRAGG